MEPSPFFFGTRLKKSGKSSGRKWRQLRRTGHTCEKIHLSILSVYISESLKSQRALYFQNKKNKKLDIAIIVKSGKEVLKSDRLNEIQADTRHSTLFAVGCVKNDNRRRRKNGKPAWLYSLRLPLQLPPRSRAISSRIWERRCSYQSSESWLEKEKRERERMVCM